MAPLKPGMSRLLLVGDERKGGTQEVVERHAAALRARGFAVATVVDRDAPLPMAHADVVVVFGGDGSLLATARRMGGDQRPTLGINRGRLGFLTAFEYDQVERALEMLLAGALVESPRFMFWCTVVGPDGTSSAPVLGVNDAVVSRAGAGGMIIVQARQGDLELCSYRGDGLIAATALGSTAYSMAAGGPVLVPDLDALVLTPLASHSLNARPLVMPVGSGVRIDLVETTAVEYAYCQIDGQVQMQVPVGGRVVLEPAAMRFRQLGHGPGYFFDVLHAKFGFAGIAAPQSR
jgi:NAD+ kinase